MSHITLSTQGIIYEISYNKNIIYINLENGENIENKDCSEAILSIIQVKDICFVDENRNILILIPGGIDTKNKQIFKHNFLKIVCKFDYEHTNDIFNSYFNHGTMLNSIDNVVEWMFKQLISLYRESGTFEKNILDIFSDPKLLLFNGNNTLGKLNGIKKPKLAKFFKEFDGNYGLILIMRIIDYFFLRLYFLLNLNISDIRNIFKTVSDMRRNTKYDPNLLNFNKELKNKFIDDDLIENIKILVNPKKSSVNKFSYFNTIFKILLRNPYIFLYNNLAKADIIYDKTHHSLKKSKRDREKEFFKGIVKTFIIPLKNSNEFGVSYDFNEDNEKTLLILKTLFNIVYKNNKLYLIERFDIINTLERYIITNSYEEASPDKYIEKYMINRKYLKGGMIVVTGGPGTGKTTYIKKISDLLLKSDDSSGYVILSFTGKAVCRIKEVIDKKNIYTIDHFIQNIADSSDIEKLKYVIIDEASMVCAELFVKLVNLLNEKCNIILLGDVDQLPPIQWGNVLEFYILNLNPNHIFRLTENYRLNNENLKTAITLFQNSEKKNFIDYLQLNKLRLEDLLQKDKKDNNIFSNKDFINGKLKILAFLNNDVDSINKKITKMFKNEKVIMLNKNYYNGSKEIILSNGSFGILTRNEFVFGEKTFSKDCFEAENIILGYATTVHKYQGSESDDIYFFIGEKGNIPDKKKLIYTAITRAKNNFYILYNQDCDKDYLMNYFF